MRELPPQKQFEPKSGVCIKSALIPPLQNGPFSHQIHGNQSKKGFGFLLAPQKKTGCHASLRDMCQCRCSKMIVLQCKRSIVAPDKMVGMFAAQSIEEPTTQLLLKTFHNAGIASKANVTRCVPRTKIMSQFKSKLCGFTLGLRVRSKTLNASRAARCVRLSRDGFRVAQVSTHVLDFFLKSS